MSTFLNLKPIGIISKPKQSSFKSEIFRTVKHQSKNINGTIYNLSDYPYLDIVLTDRCNSRCKFCISDLIHDKLDCNVDIFKRQIEYAVKEFGVKEVLLLGGEPTISPVLFEMISFCTTLNLNKICLTTNGKKLHQSKEFTQELMASGLTHINISIMSLDSGSQSFVHGTGVGNMDLNSLARAYKEATKHGVHLRINSNIYKSNHDNGSDMFGFYQAVKCFCDSLKFSPLLQTDSFSTVDEVTEFNKRYILTPTQYEELFNGFCSHFEENTPIVSNKATFGFVEYKMICLEPPIILNYNHRGQMMKRAVEFNEINNIKLLPNGNLSRSWNREDLTQVLKEG